MARRTARNLIARDIFFYRADLGLNAGGVPIPVPFHRILAAVEAIPVTSPDRYMRVDENTLVRSWVDKSDWPVNFRLGNVRRRDLPTMDTGGVDTLPLPIPAGAGLAEIVHYGCYRIQDQGVTMTVLASDWNFHGPRVSRLEAYLQSRGGSDLSRLRIRPLLQPQAHRQLSQIGEIRLVSLRISTSILDIVKSVDDDLGAALESASSSYHAEDLEVVLRTAPHSRRALSGKIRSTLRSLLSRVSFREGAKKVLITGVAQGETRARSFNMLERYLTRSEQMVQLDGRTRGVEPFSAYNAIDKAISSMRQEILESAALDIEQAKQDGDD